jgi:hypothetical protein
MKKLIIAIITFIAITGFAYLSYGASITTIQSSDNAKTALTTTINTNFTNLNADVATRLDSATASATYQPLSAPLSSITGGTWQGSTTIVKLGTITAGTWNGTALADAYVADDITATNYLLKSAYLATTTHTAITTLPAYNFEKCFTVASTTFNSFDDVPLWYPSKAITVQQQRCKADGGTSIVLALTDGTNTMSSSTCATTFSTSTPASNNTWTADERMEVDFGTVTGAVNWVNYCIKYTEQ